VQGVDARDGGHGGLQRVVADLRALFHSLGHRLDFFDARSGDIGLLRGPALVDHEVADLGDGAGVFEQVVIGWRQGNEARDAHRFRVAGVRVEDVGVDDHVGEGDTGFAFLEPAQRVVGGARTDLQARLLVVEVGAGAAAALQLEAGGFHDEGGADGFFEEFFGLGRVFEFAENLDVTVGGDGARFFLHAFFHRGQILRRINQREAERTGLRGHDGHALCGVVTDLVEDDHEGGGGIGGFVFDDGGGLALDGRTQCRAHHALQGGGHDFTEVGGFITGLFKGWD